MTQTKTKLGRRNFILAASAGGAATAAAIVARTASKPKPVAADSDKRSGKGYQVSEHINNYYRTTKV
ncbi:MAG: hypothetical protein HY017_31920 [Betaproteobacteria bacterium]|nr:hypothetical protein [Betaproteobacteria bacterium]